MTPKYTGGDDVDEDIESKRHQEFLKALPSREQEHDEILESKKHPAQNEEVAEDPDVVSKLVRSRVQYGPLCPTFHSSAGHVSWIFPPSKMPPSNKLSPSLSSLSSTSSWPLRVQSRARSSCSHAWFSLGSAIERRWAIRETRRRRLSCRSALACQTIQAIPSASASASVASDQLRVEGPVRSSQGGHVGWHGLGGADSDDSSACWYNNLRSLF